MVNIMHLIAVPRVCKGLSGGDKVILTLSQYIDKSKFSVVIVVLKDSDFAVSYLIQEANKISVPTDIVEMHNKFDLKAIPRLKELFKKYKINILHCHGYKADLIGFLVTRFTSVKLISTVHGWIGVDLKVKFYDLLDLIILRFFSKVIAVANTFRDRLLCWGISKDKIVVINNSIDVDMVNQSPIITDIKAEFNISPGTKIVGTIGRISTEKGHRYFLEAAIEVNKAYKNLIFFIVGEGPLKAGLIKYAEKKGLADKVIFTGFRQDAINFLKVIDVFVLPSIKEGFPISLLEAMGLGKAIVATDVGDVSFMIKNLETGILVKPKNFHEISDGIMKLLNDVELAARLENNAKDFAAQRFSVKRQINEYHKVYEEAARH